MARLPLKKRRRRLLINSLIWACLLAFFSIKTVEEAPRVPLPHADKILHFASYAVLAFLLCLYFRFKRSLGTITMVGHAALFCAFISSTLWGGAMELLQFTAPGRTPDWYDFLANSTGAVAGIWCFTRYEKLPRPVIRHLKWYTL